MRCSKARDYLSRDIDGLLPPDATAGLLVHLDACEECRSFREDLQTGRRLLAATEPQLPDNFDWKLQLRLNQALQQRAGETAYPWLEDEPATRRGAWWPAFGAAASVGLAAVLAVAVFMGPQRGAPVMTAAVGPAPVVATAPANEPALAPSTTATSPAASLAGRSDRRSLFGAPRGGGLYDQGIGRSVATGARVAQPGAVIDRGWSGNRLEDLQTIQRLRERNDQLLRMVYQYEMQMRTLKARLDTTGTPNLDTGDNH
jgi:hypothetical protein